jgi:hypothetical protein
LILKFERTRWQNRRKRIKRQEKQQEKRQGNQYRERERPGRKPALRAEVSILFVEFFCYFVFFVL